MVCFQKLSHLAPCSFTSILTVMCRSRNMLLLGDASREGFIFVFQEEVNNKYSPMGQQHNICSVTLRRRNGAVALFKSSNIKVRTMKSKMTLCCISGATKCG